MLDGFIMSVKTHPEKPSISVLIPTWNNLAILQWCIDALRKHSQVKLQIIVFVNEGKDNTLDWVKEQPDIDYVMSPENVGICYALNSCRSMVRADYLLYLNDDMYVLPEWDTLLMEQIEALDTKMFMLSATLIEPRGTGNPCVVVKDFGSELASFQEEELLKHYRKLRKGNWVGSTWPPNIMHIDLWDLVGGLSIEYSPGLYSDPDFSKKIYDAGVRHYIGVGNSLVYHFGSKSTKRLKKNTGRIQFIMKWGLTAKTFTRQILNIGKPLANNQVEDSIVLSSKTKVINKLKKIYYSNK